MCGIISIAPKKTVAHRNGTIVGSVPSRGGNLQKNSATAPINFSINS